MKSVGPRGNGYSGSLFASLFFIYLWHTTASVTWASPFLSTSLLDAIAICQKRNLFSRWPITYPAYGLEHIVRNG